ncbi:hypothetical protein K440DRAFT_664976 [Wilcoxina mikolae CBS 423.85]|nr:hypothetical protein K440DRAFT_664976 [Wilcoxina mikolae CBS 423.85]
MPTMISTAISGGAHLSNGDIRLWIYAQDTQGRLHEKRYNGGWRASSDLGSFRAKIGTPLAVSFVEIEGGVIARLVYINPSGYIECVKNTNCRTELGGTWTPDPAVNSLQVKPHRASKLAIVETRNRGFIYYQGRNLKLCQIDFQDGSWSDLGDMDGISRRVVGSAIAAVAGNGFETLKIFSQNADLELEEHYSDGNGDTWSLGDFHPSEHLFPPGAPISVVPMGNTLSLWTANETNDLIEFIHDGGWDQGEQRAKTCRGTSVHGVMWGNSFRIYYQGENGIYVREVARDGGSYYQGGLEWST